MNVLTLFTCSFTKWYKSTCRTQEIRDPVLDPDPVCPHLIRLPGSGSLILNHGSGSGSSRYQTKRLENFQKKLNVDIKKFKKYIIYDRTYLTTYFSMVTERVWPDPN
jgi:hypothetical protein